MAESVVGLDEEDRSFGVYQTGFAPDLSAVKLDERQDATTIRKVMDIATSDLMTPPHAAGSSLVDRVATVEEVEAQNAHLEKLHEELASYTETISEDRGLDFPNLAWESVKLGLAKEKVVNAQLIGHIKEAEQHQKDIDLLLDFSAELTAHKKESGEMSEKMKDLLAQLKERGIDLWKREDHNLNEERVSDLKSLTNSQVDKLRSNLQIAFTTKIQTLIQSIGAIMDTLKDIIRNNNKLINSANRLPGH